MDDLPQDQIMDEINTSTSLNEVDELNPPTRLISVVAISDSHSMHTSLQMDSNIPCDLFLHSGDLTQHGTKEELQDAINWTGNLPHKHKIVIAGNHDVGLDK